MESQIEDPYLPRDSSLPNANYKGMVIECPKSTLQGRSAITARTISPQAGREGHACLSIGRAGSLAGIATRAALNLPELHPVRVIWLIENVCLWRNLSWCQYHLQVAKGDLQGSNTAWLPAEPQLIYSSSQSHSRLVTEGPSNGRPATLSCQRVYMSKTALGKWNAFHIAANVDMGFNHALNSSSRVV